MHAVLGGSKFSLRWLLAFVTLMAVLCAANCVRIAVIIALATAINLLLGYIGERMIATTNPPQRRLRRSGPTSSPVLYQIPFLMVVIYLTVFHWHLFMYAVYIWPYIPLEMNAEIGGGLSLRMVEHAVLFSLNVLVVLSFVAECCATRSLSPARTLQTTLASLLLGYAHWAVPGGW